MARRTPDDQPGRSPDARLRPVFRVATAALAGAVAMAGSFAVAGNTPEFVVAPVNAFVVNSSPAALVAFSIQTLGHLGDLLAFAFSVFLTFVILALAAGVGLEVGSRTSLPFASAAVAGVAVWAVTTGLTGDPVAALVSAVPAAAVVAIPTRIHGTPPADAAVRRRFLAAAGGVVGFGVVAYFLGRQRTLPPRESMPAPAAATRLADQASARQLDVAGIPGLVSDTDAFYQVDIDAINPMVDASTWTLSVTGAVDQELSLSYADLRGMPAETKYKTLRCVGENLNAHLMDNAIWTGVPVRALLERANPGGACGCVLLRAADGYAEEFPLAALETAFLAYGMNGVSLPRAHGYPVRALVPGHWGEINVKWLTEIVALEQRVEGYWEQRGWHGTGPVNTVAKLWAINHLDGGRVQVAGQAYAGTRGISRVQVSTDGGSTWSDATLSEPLDEADVLGQRDVWRQWQYTWTPTSGEHTVVVRATDGDGRLQSQESSPAFPNGASGWVSVTVRA